MIIKEYFINENFYDWLRSTYSVVNFEIEGDDAYILAKFDNVNDTLILESNEIKIVGDSKGERLYFKNIIIEKQTIFNGKEVKHYPFLDQFMLNEVYCDMAIQILKATK